MGTEKSDIKRKHEDFDDEDEPVVKTSIVVTIHKTK
jgi:hypothetical protein